MSVVMRATSSEPLILSPGDVTVLDIRHSVSNIPGAPKGE
jgi:hypothetical protein